MTQTIADQAIAAALKQDWPLAIDLNQQILENDPHDIATLNRLARAYKETGDLKTAKSTYEHVLDLDPYNTIAQNNLKNLKLPHASSNGVVQAMNTNFIEEPGKTKTVSLNRLGDVKVLATLRPGQVVKLLPKTHCIAIHTMDEGYVGSLADDLSFRLKPFISKGNQYVASIKSASGSQVLVFLRETKRCPECRDTPSF